MSHGPHIALVDDHPIVRSALRATLGALGAGVTFVEAGDAASALALAEGRPDLDLMLMDLAMPGADGTRTVRAIRARVPQLPLAIVSANEEPAAVAELLGLGVCGFIPKSDSSNVILSAVRLILDGGTYVPARYALAPRSVAGPPGGTVAERLGLTDRQADVLRLLGEGKSNKVIARELGITEGTVKVHLLAVFRTLDVRNRTAAVLAAQRHGGGERP